MDEETKGLLFEGASISQLGKLFGMDNRTVQSKITGVEPCGRRAGHPIYAVKDAAPFLVETQLDVNDIEQVIAYVRKLNHTNLPKMLTKEFWAAMTAKQRFEENAGDLWRTDKVSEVFADLVKAVRIPLVLANDTIANEMELSESQQKALTHIIDGLLEELSDAVAKQFGPGTAAQLGEGDL
jgi:hypothetical protein